MLPLLVLTHPLARTSTPASIFSRSLTLVLTISICFVSLKKQPSWVRGLLANFSGGFLFSALSC